ncbi:MAG: radical SAM protein [Verrucomicrobiae bacterium]|nr:radical SAM protein [Verrucomicrobiae bacterium]
MNRLVSIARQSFKRDGPPQIVLFVTRRCNAHCKFCFYPPSKTPEMTLEEYDRLSQTIGRLHWVLVGGGEPFLRDDLGEIGLLFHRNAGVRYLQIPTNGSMPDRVENIVRQICPKAPDLQFVVSISVDDTDPARHDEVRGIPGCFDKAMAAMRLLQSLKKEFPNLGSACNMTFTAYNQDRFLDIYRQAESSFPVDTLSVGLVRGKTVCDDAGQGLDMEKYRRVHEYLSRSHKRYGFFRGLEQRLARAKDIVQREMIMEIKKHKRMPLPCLAGLKSLVILETGDIYPCEMLFDRKLGNLRDFDGDFSRFWQSPPAREFRQWKKTCHCTYECAIAQSIIFTPQGFCRTLLAAMRKQD